MACLGLPKRLQISNKLLQNGFPNHLHFDRFWTPFWNNFHPFGSPLWAPGSLQESLSGAIRCQKRATVLDPIAPFCLLWLGTPLGPSWDPPGTLQGPSRDPPGTLLDPSGERCRHLFRPTILRPIFTNLTHPRKPESLGKACLSLARNQYFKGVGFGSSEKRSRPGLTRTLAERVFVRPIPNAVSVRRGVHLHVAHAVDA